ncbi:MAG: sigma factor-like helix-turn-helix DNA-binding protein [Polyangiaceae bacterium]
MTALYAALGSLDVDTQLAFTLRHVEGLELTEVAELTELSLATVKRRLLEAERSLLARAPDLKDLVAEFSS